MVETRSKFVRLLELHEARAETAERQCAAMRDRYLELLVYGRRVVALERAVFEVVAQAERSGGVDMVAVKRLAEARARLGDAVDVDPPDGALRALGPFLRGKPTRVLLTGRQLEYFRTIVAWIHGLMSD